MWPVDTTLDRTTDGRRSGGCAGFELLLSLSFPHKHTLGIKENFQVDTQHRTGAKETAVVISCISEQAWESPTVFDFILCYCLCFPLLSKNLPLHLGYLKQQMCFLTLSVNWDGPGMD